MSTPSLDTFKRQLRESFPDLPEHHLLAVAKAVDRASTRLGSWYENISTAVVDVLKYLNVADTRPEKATDPNSHLFYTQLGADGKPAPGIAALPISLIVYVTTPYRRANSAEYRLVFEVKGKDFNWACWGDSDEATESMHRDLMERWGALRRSGAEPPRMERFALSNAGHRIDALTKKLDEYEAERDLAREHERQAVEIERDQLKVSLDQAEGQFNEHLRKVRDELQTLVQTEGDKAIAEISAKEGEIRKHMESLTTERDQIKVSLEESLRNMHTMVAERDKALERARELETHVKEAPWASSLQHACLNAMKAERDKALEQIRQLEIERDHIAGVAGADAKAEIAKLKAKHEAEFAEVVSRLDGILLQRNQLEADLKEAVGACDKALERATSAELQAQIKRWEEGQAPINIPQLTVVGNQDQPQQLSTGEYVSDGNPLAFDTERGRRFAELAAKIPADQRGLSLEEINAEVGRPCTIRPDYQVRVLLDNILGCFPRQFTDRRNPDHLRVVVDLLPIMRMDKSKGGWGEVAEGFDQLAAEKAAAKKVERQKAAEEESAGFHP